MLLQTFPWFSVGHSAGDVLGLEERGWGMHWRQPHQAFAIPANIDSKTETGNNTEILEVKHLYYFKLLLNISSSPTRYTIPILILQREAMSQLLSNKSYVHMENYNTLFLLLWELWNAPHSIWVLPSCQREGNKVEPICTWKQCTFCQAWHPCPGQWKREDNRNGV